MWEKISNNRMQKEKKGYFLIKPEMEVESVPLFCPVCDKKMKNLQDCLTYKKYQACHYCTTMYAEVDPKRWKEGWRPDLSEID